MFRFIPLVFVLGLVVGAYAWSPYTKFEFGTVAKPEFLRTTWIALEFMFISLGDNDTIQTFAAIAMGALYGVCFAVVFTALSIFDAVERHDN